MLKGLRRPFWAYKVLSNQMVIMTVLAGSTVVTERSAVMLRKQAAETLDYLKLWVRS